MANTNENNVNVVLTEEGMNTLINKFAKKTDERYLFRKQEFIYDTYTDYKSPNEHININGYINAFDDGNGNIDSFEIYYDEISYNRMVNVYFDGNCSELHIHGINDGEIINFDSCNIGNVLVGKRINTLFTIPTIENYGSEILTNYELRKQKIVEFRNIIDNFFFYIDTKLYGSREALIDYYRNSFSLTQPDPTYNKMSECGEFDFNLCYEDSSNEQILSFMDSNNVSTLYMGCRLSISSGVGKNLTTAFNNKEWYRPSLYMDTLTFSKNANNDIHCSFDSFNDAANLGSTEHRWNNIYAVNGTIQTSDRNKKNSITPLDDEETRNLIMGLIPSHYKMNTGTRTHYGLIAQDVEELLDKLNIPSTDFAGFIKSPKTITKYEDEDGNKLKKPITEIVEGEYEYSLRYDEFISPMIKMIQMQQNTIETQQEKINDLESRLSKLESIINNTNNETE